MNKNVKESQRAVFKLRYAGRLFYQLGYNCEDARRNLGRELRVKPEEIEVLDNGRKQ